MFMFGNTDSSIKKWLYCLETWIVAYKENNISELM